jgi:hypothetical protein
MTIKTAPWEVPDRKNFFSSRMGYHHQAIARRKFFENFCAQIAPTLVHLNLAKGIKTLVNIKLFYNNKKIYFHN